MKIIFLTSIFLLSSCYLFESDYERLIKDVRAQKLKEKKQGIPNPVFEGVTEPDFPDEEENNKTFEGVDANKDGIRDDIEIWINRISEDKEVRIATKHYLKMRMKFVLGTFNNVQPETNTENLGKSGDALYCLSKSFGPLRKKYLNTYHKSPELERKRMINELVFNNYSRNKILNKSETIALGGLLHTNEVDKFNNCSQYNNINYLKKEW